MLRRTATVVPVVALALVGSGCGTLTNHNTPGSFFNGRGFTPYRPYGGVLVDADMVVFNAVRVVGHEEEGYDSPDFGSAVSAAGFLFIDLPVSAVADTVLLPFDVTNTLLGKGRPPEGGWPLLHIPSRANVKDDQKPPAVETGEPGNALDRLNSNSFSNWTGSFYEVETKAPARP